MDQNYNTAKIGTVEDLISFPTVLFHKLQCFSNTTITLLKVHKTNIASILFKRKTVHKKCLRPSYKLNVHICMYTFLYVYIIYIYISFTYTYISIGNVCRWLIVCVISVRQQGAQKIQVSRKNIELFDLICRCVYEMWVSRGFALQLAAYFYHQQTG